jgi:hypothetical protein
MKNRSQIKSFICALTIVTLAAANSATAAPAKETVVKAADAVIVRPICFASTVVGGALFALSLPVSAITKRVKPSAEALVLKPARATFQRPLGNMEALGD